MKNLILFFIGVFFTTIVVAQDTYLHCGKRIDTKSGKVYKK